jgi:hypothetical protein
MSYVLSIWTVGPNPSLSATQSGTQRNLPLILQSPQDRSKWPQFRESCSYTGLEEVSRLCSQALRQDFEAHFSEGPIGSPVSKTPAGEGNAITNR